MIIMKVIMNTHTKLGDFLKQQIVVLGAISHHPPLSRSTTRMGLLKWGILIAL